MNNEPSRLDPGMTKLQREMVLLRMSLIARLTTQLSASSLEKLLTVQSHLNGEDAAGRADEGARAGFQWKNWVMMPVKHYRIRLAAWLARLRLRRGLRGR